LKHIFIDLVHLDSNILKILAISKRLILKENIKLKYADLEILRSEIRTLEAKLAELASVDEKEIESNILGLKAESTELIKSHIRNLSALNESLGSTKDFLENALRENIDTATANLHSIQNGLTETLKLLSHKPLKDCFEGFTKGYGDLVTDYNKYVIKISEVKSDLEKISKEHDMVLGTFAAHRLENEKIYGVLGSREGVLTHVELLNKEIRERLEKYDQEIRAIIEKRDQLPIYQLKEKQ